MVTDILLRLIWGIASAGVARGKGRNPVVWFIAGFVFEWISLLIVLILPRVGGGSFFSRPDSSGSGTHWRRKIEKTCPYCGQRIIIDDIPGNWVCPECGRTVQYDGSGPVHAANAGALLPQVTWMVTLFAKLAKGDGVVTENEVRQVDIIVRQAFQPNKVQLKQIMATFNQARYSAETFEDVAHKLYLIAGGRRDFLTDTLTALLAIACADGVLRPEEDTMIRGAAAIFRLDGVYEQIKAEFFNRVHPEEQTVSLDSSYQLLGCGPSDSDEAVKKAYRRKIKENHPDRLAGQGATDEMIREANQKITAIKKAYDRIMTARS
ncbi:TerB family tellurite resistance protein [Sporolactobacillus vineae]|uniref:TerB family tellurite resistance protein n=1 Tax=Sporolactobacillus vineae TaxID=444463 RepID=UPI0002888B34|nr:TerB family tellurite resistance protein [Sporolactobacillus vineae]